MPIFPFEQAVTLMLFCKGSFTCSIDSTSEPVFRTSLFFVHSGIIMFTKLNTSINFLSLYVDSFPLKLQTVT